MAKIDDKDIAALRCQLDTLDKTLIETFVSRMNIVKKISQIKHAKNLPVFDKSREDEVIESRMKYVLAPELKSCTKEFIQLLMDISKKEQRKIFTDTEQETKFTVAYQGLPGSYSYQALKQYFGDNCNSTAFPTFADVFTALAHNKADYGVLPLENSSTGSITAVYDLLIRFGCYISGEEIVAVDHCLLGLPDSDIGNITTIFSHEQGFQQCSHYLANHTEWEHITYHNTAISAKHVSQSANPAWAAIASKSAAKAYGLKILAENIQNEVNNYTRFIIVSPKMRKDENCNKTSVCFVIKHESGSLSSILAVFAKHNLNLLKLESRPIIGEAWKYRFYIDIESGVGSSLEQAFSEISSSCDEWRFLGTYPSAIKKG